MKRQKLAFGNGTVLKVIGRRRKFEEAPRLKKLFGSEKWANILMNTIQASLVVLSIAWWIPQIVNVYKVGGIAFPWLSVFFGVSYNTLSIIDFILRRQFVYIILSLISLTMYFLIFLKKI